jgi:hypothetical protein
MATQRLYQRTKKIEHLKIFFFWAVTSCRLELNANVFEKHCLSLQPLRWTKHVSHKGLYLPSKRHNPEYNIVIFTAVRS